MNIGKYVVTAFLVSFALNCAAAENQPSLKGGECQIIERTAEFRCHHIGTVKSVKEIYEKGFRVVASYVYKITASGMGITTLIIEEQRK